MVNENEQDLKDLQLTLDTSIDNAGAFIKSSFRMPEHSLNAEQLVQFVGIGKTVALSTVTKAGAPRVAPIGTVFFRGEFYIPTVMSAMRTRHLIRNSEISITYYQGDDIAIIVHGKAELIQPDREDFDIIQKVYGDNMQGWGKGNEGVFIRIKADKIFTYVNKPEDFKKKQA